MQVSLSLKFAAPILFEGLSEAMLARRSKGLNSGSPGPLFGGVLGPAQGATHLFSEQLNAKVRLHITHDVPVTDREDTRPDFDRVLDRVWESSD